MERLEFDLLFRWFVGLGVDDPAWDHSVFSKNRDRLLEGAIAAEFLAAVLARPGIKRLLSSRHLSVDGATIEAWASKLFNFRIPDQTIRAPISVVPVRLRFTARPAQRGQAEDRVHFAVSLR